MKDEFPGGEAALDAVIVGGGMAGLSAAMRLSDRRILLLEETDRLGGRVHSQAAGGYWMNFGAHMIGDRESHAGRLADRLEVEARPIRGRLLGLSLEGRRLLHAPPATYPFALPLPLRSRAGFLAMGLRLRAGHARLRRLLRSLDGASATERRSALLHFEGERTLAELIGPLPADLGRLLVAFTERNGGDPSEMSAGHAIRSFANVWSADAPGRNILGGSSLLPEAIANRLGGRIITGAAVRSVRAAGTGVAVRYETADGAHHLSARTAIVAVPAPVARRIVEDLPSATAAALDRIVYGAFLTAAVITRETSAMPWDGNYAIATPGRRFSVLFNMATTLRGPGARKPGGTLMLFRGARGAAALLDYGDARLESMFADDLAAEFPEARGLIDAIAIKRWELGAPFSRPGRARMQDDLTADFGPITLAGDYLDFPNLEAAIASGEEAADRARARFESGWSGEAPAGASDRELPSQPTQSARDLGSGRNAQLARHDT